MSSKINKVSKEELEKQRQYQSLVKELIEVRKRKEKPLASLHIYGCQQNVSDGEIIRGMLSNMGYEFTENDEEADFILFNTCAIREHAEDRVFGNVGALKPLKKIHPSTVIALCGCMMQQEHIVEKIKKSYPFVNIVFGTHAIYKLPELLYTNLLAGKRVFCVEEGEGIIAEGLDVNREGSLKAWIPIMYGCNNFCTYCVVPYVRGRERSREKEDILKEVKEVVSSGYKEMTLLGQNVNSYGKNLENPVSFSNLINEIDKVDGDFWIRFMTSHPKDCTKELIDTIASSDKISKHLHLPFQSGSSRVLKAMNRGYTREEYLSLVNYAKEKIPGVCLTSDVIVGFPGETEEDFLQTLSLIQEVGYTSLYTFIFSPREGTPAIKMDDPIASSEKSKWFTKLLEVQDEIGTKKCEEMIGNTEKVLVEGTTKNGELTGRTSGNIIVEMPFKEGVVGQFVTVKITSSKHWTLRGEIV